MLIFLCIRISYDKENCKPMNIDKKTTSSSGKIDVTINPNVSTGGGKNREVGILDEKSLRDLAKIPDSFKTLQFRTNSWVQQDSQGPFIAHQCKAIFEPPSQKELAISMLIKELKNESPYCKKLYYEPRFTENPCMLEISIPDLHFGSIVEPELWNLEKAKKTYLAIIEEFIFLSKDKNIEKILFPIGNDFFHMDNSFKTTTGGTFLEDAANYNNTFKQGIDLLISAIDRLSCIAQVEVITIPGNHDYNSIIHTGMILDAYYRNDENVIINANFSSYKFVKYGNSLIGFEHGDEHRGVNMKTLPALMASEVPEAWAASKYREWHLGDRHRQGAVAFADQGVVIEYLPSLSAANEWSTRKGFTHHRRCAVAFIWDKVKGQTNRLQVNIDSV